MADYSLAQIHAMQEEAARRVREMSRRSKSNISAGNPNGDGGEKPLPNPHGGAQEDHRGGHSHGGQGGPNEKSDRRNGQPPSAISTSHKAPLSFLRSLDLKQLISGGDQSLLLLIIMLLMTDSENDDFLLYALIYIML